jgi:hypothetical protein
MREPSARSSALHNSTTTGFGLYHPYHQQSRFVVTDRMVDDDIREIDLLSCDDLFCIFSYLRLEDLCVVCRVCQSWYKQIEQDSERVLWTNFTNRHEWLWKLGQDEIFQKEIRKQLSGWKRFLSIFADNYSMVMILGYILTRL